LKIDALFLDVDGVLTDGKYYNFEGQCKYKKFVDQDFTAIKLFKKLGVYVAWVSGDRYVNENIAKIRDINFFYERDNKLEVIKELGFNMNRVCYVGDDYFDVPVLRNVGFPFCPKNSPFYVKKYSNVLDGNGGCGVVPEILEKVIGDETIGTWKLH